MKRTLEKSVPEKRADTILEVRRKGRATLNEAALIFERSRPTVKKWVDARELAGFQIGTRTYIAYEEIVRYQREGPADPTQEDG